MEKRNHRFEEKKHMYKTEKYCGPKRKIEITKIWVKILVPNFELKC